jgi:hypothetical protein
VQSAALGDAENRTQALCIITAMPTARLVASGEVMARRTTAPKVPQTS